jgi:hypothetical protein
MVLMLAAVLGVAVGLLFGGTLSKLGSLPLRGLPLFGLAIGLQVVAYPPAWASWQPSDGLATWLWIVSYGVVILVAVQNRRIAGFPLAALGMLSNLVAVSTNGGHMPALKSAMIDASVDYHRVHMNSVAAHAPNLPWLIDRWGAPWWVPMANVYSIGDVLLAAGALWIVAAGMGARLPRLPRRQPA